MKRKSGFTIIEVSLVLAIAGLIFLMMFIALPALQRSARDTQRRDDMSALTNAIKRFQSNNRGALPNGEGTVTYDASASSENTWQGFYKKYLGESFVDPNGEGYKLYVIDCEGATVGAECPNSEASYAEASFPNDFKVTIVRGATCNAEKAETSSNPRKLAVLYKLEGGGVYCSNT